MRHLRRGFAATPAHPPSPWPRRPRQLAVEQGGGLVGGHVEDGEVAWEGGEDGLVLGPVSVEANVPSEAAVPDPQLLSEREL